jgi:Flp pilus assembly protein TadD
VRFPSALAALFAAGVVALALSGCSHLVVLRDPLTAGEHNDLGVVYESSGQPELAAREYRRSLRLDPAAPRTWVNLGNAEAAAGRWRAAERCYRRALRDAPDDPDAMNNLAVALVRQDRHRDEARALAERAVAAGGERDSLYRATLDEANLAPAASRIH